jgi:zinc/manganese transport system substrate-binding protein
VTIRVPRLMTPPLALVAVATFALGTGALGFAESVSEPSGLRLAVVVTTTILADMVRNVVGDAAHISVLIPSGADPHDFRASARQVAQMVRADLVVAHGAGLEEGLASVLASVAGDGANVLSLTPLLAPLSYNGGPAFDPHTWLDPLRMAAAAHLLANALAHICPREERNFRPAAAAYARRLRAADAQIQAVVATIPAGRRKLITNHDSLAYFADRYGFEVVATVVPGPSSARAPSSRQLARLVQLLDAAGVRAIFAETTQPATLALALAAEASGGVQVVELFTGSLGAPGSGADTLIGMLQTNAERIAAALR